MSISSSVLLDQTPLQVHPPDLPLWVSMGYVQRWEGAIIRGTSIIRANTLSCLKFLYNYSLLLHFLTTGYIWIFVINVLPWQGLIILFIYLFIYFGIFEEIKSRVRYFYLLIYLYTTVCIQFFIQTYVIIDFVTVKNIKKLYFW